MSYDAVSGIARRIVSFPADEHSDNGLPTRPIELATSRDTRTRRPGQDGFRQGLEAGDGGLSSEAGYAAFQPHFPRRCAENRWPQPMQDDGVLAFEHYWLIFPFSQKNIETLHIRACFERALTRRCGCEWKHAERMRKLARARVDMTIGHRTEILTRVKKHREPRSLRGCNATQPLHCAYRLCVILQHINPVAHALSAAEGRQN
ncbi:hypothetical protein LZ32DRAFT_599485 [Colletotrichum eremochloae]|nr:hypothetical protein LZ32DRAFT_599485 [Colletotrichum eremochloae]